MAGLDERRDIGTSSGNAEQPMRLDTIKQEKRERQERREQIERIIEAAQKSVERTTPNTGRTATEAKGWKEQAKKLLETPEGMKMDVNKLLKVANEKRIEENDERSLKEKVRESKNNHLRWMMIEVNLSRQISPQGESSTMRRSSGKNNEVPDVSSQRGFSETIEEGDNLQKLYNGLEDAEREIVEKNPDIRNISKKAFNARILLRDSIVERDNVFYGVEKFNDVQKRALDDIVREAEEEYRDSSKRKLFAPLMNAAIEKASLFTQGEMNNPQSDSPNKSPDTSEKPDPYASARSSFDDDKKPVQPYSPLDES